MAEFSSATNNAVAEWQGVEGVVARISRDAVGRVRRARAMRWFDVLFRSLTAILAVVSPALVTYSTRPNVDAIYQLAAILMTGIAGAAATLQAIFGFQGEYIRNRLDALDLLELMGEIEQKNEQLKLISDERERYAQQKLLLSEAARRQKEIMISKQRAHLQSLQSVNPT